MPRLVVPLVAGALAVLALATGASSVPCGPTTCAPLSSTVAGSRTLVVRPRGLTGPLVAYDLAAARVAARLPAGVLSADGRRYVTAASASTSGRRTRVTRYDATTGKRLGLMQLPEWNLKVGAVSADGRYAALVWGTKSPDVWIVDLNRSRLVRKVHLDGDWGVDALSGDGRRLYLLEYNTKGGYAVRVHDATRGLVPGAITDPHEPEPMTGVPWSSTATRDGSWQLTLYLEPGNTRSEAFVHALSLTGSTAACIDLPGGEFMAAGRYALVLGPGGGTLYAANASLGVVATIDLATRKVVDTVHFAPASADTSTSSAFGTISPDGSTLYFTAGRALLAYDTASRTVRGPYQAGAVGGIGFQPSGRAVLVVRRDGTTIRIDAASGAPVST
jgi:Tol biopolymer transport system component